MAARNTQTPIEVAIDSKANARLSQLPVEVAIDGAPDARISQLPLEVVIDGQGNVRLSQESIEVLLDALPGVHISQIVLEIAAKFIEVPVPLIYPKLPGIQPAVGWETQFFNTPEELTVAGGKVVLGIADTPLHTFTLGYNFLRYDLSYREEQLLRGFFGANRGNLGRFKYRNEKDCKVVAQRIGTTDGTTRIYTLTRTYGVGESSWDEPIGYLDETKPFNLYLNGVLQDKGTYTLDMTIGAQQQVIFAGVPTASQEIDVDMDYFYYCKFVDPKISIDKFLKGFSSADKIAIESCRPGL